MKKTIILILTLLIIIAFFEAMILINNQLDDTANPPDNEKPKNVYTYTKAICNSDNYCQDSIIECEEDKVTKISPITGAIVHFSDDWKDPRDKETIDKLCG